MGSVALWLQPDHLLHLLLQLINHNLKYMSARLCQQWTMILFLLFLGVWTCKSWRPVTNPVDGTPGFGFCEFESAEGSLRARRLLTKLSVDGQELVLNINQATREYLEKYGEKNTIEEKAKEAEAEARDGMVSSADNENCSSRAIPYVTARGAGDGGQMSTQGKTKGCWNVTEEDSDADKDAMHT